jgi:putative multiple sugar transport system permease protein
MSENVGTTDIKTLIKNNIRNYSMFIMLALIMIIFIPLTDGNNWSPRNFTNIFFQYSYVLILAIGMVMVIIVQGIDLSVGSVCAFVGALSAMVYNRGAGTFGTLLAALLMGAAVGAYQGAWVAYGRIPAFIVTLSGMQLFRGLTYIITKVNPISLKNNGYSLLATGTLDEVMNFGKIPFPYITGAIRIGNNGVEVTKYLSFKDGPYFPMALILAVLVLTVFFITEFITRKKKIANEFEVSSLPLFITKLVLISILTLGLADRFARYRGLPVVALILGIAIFVFHFILNNTVLGRYIYAVGGNPRSAKLSGINSELVTFIVFVFMGVMTGLAAVVSTGYMNSALPQAGNLFELDAIAACYIGGVSAGGGIGSVIGVIVGGFVMSSINNGMSLMNLGTHYQYVVRALILLFAVFFDIYTRRKAGLG